MNGVLSFALAVLIYPGLLVAVVAGVALLMAWELATALRALRSPDAPARQLA